MKELSEISLLAVPPKFKKKPAEGEETAGAGATPFFDKDEVPAGLVNELGILSGKFGWCVACRATANLYCKHTRHPVCSFECKQRHIKLLEESSATNET